MLAVGSWAHGPCSGKAKGTMGMALAACEPNTDKNMVFPAIMKFITLSVLVCSI